MQSQWNAPPTPPADRREAVRFFGHDICAQACRLIPSSDTRNQLQGLVEEGGEGGALRCVGARPYRVGKDWALELFPAVVLRSRVTFLLPEVHRQTWTETICICSRSNNDPCRGEGLGNLFRSGCRSVSLSASVTVP
jgi:hypothetical protein